jgi:hypothetical protein
MTTQQTQINDLNETVLYVQNNEWTCILDTTKKSKTVKLGLVVEAIDMREIDSEHDNEPYPVMLECSIVVDAKSLSKRYLKRVHDNDGNESREAWQIDSYMYSGGVPVDMEGITSNAKSNVDNELRTWFNQRRGEFKTRQFRTIEDALEYARNVYAHNAITLFGLVGFYLDKTVNLVGTTGWDIIGLQAQNHDYL